MPERRTADLSDAAVARLKRVGFWYSDREPLLPHPRDYLDSNWNAQERDRVIQYLDSSYKAPYLMFGYSSCRLGCPGTPEDIGTQDLTDGTWIFPEGLAHYVRHHGLKPPAGFLEHVRAGNYVVPRLIEIAAKAAAQPTRRSVAPPTVAVDPARSSFIAPVTRTPAPEPNTVCFVCGAGAFSFFRSRSRAACGPCHHRTRLVVGGASLSTVLRSTRSSPLEGSGLNAVLNPVEIDGHRGWATFLGGSFQVLEETEPSRDYFDFRVQHVEPGPSILRAIHAAGLTATADVKQLMAVLAGMRPQFDMNDLLAGLPWLSLEAQAAVAAFLPLTSNEQAWKAVEARMAKDRGTDDDHWAHIGRLVSLAQRSHTEPI